MRRLPKIKYLRSMTALASGVAMLATASGYAAENDKDEDQVTFDEVIVTARFKEESVQDIGQSISALGAQAIENAGIVDFDDIANRTVGLDFSDRGPNRNEISIRGIAKPVNTSTLDILPSQAVVGLFLDDVPLITPNASQRDINAFDLQRVEILRGPQPTYFGEGALSGAIRYFATDPTLAGGVSGKAEATVSSTKGSDLSYNINGALDFTFKEDVAGLRIVGFHRDDDGFIDHVQTGTEDVNFYESSGGRIIFLAKPSEDFTIRAAAHIAYDDVGGDWLVDSTDEPLQLSSSPFLSTGTDEFQLYTLKLDYDFGPITVTSVTGFYDRVRTNSGLDFVQSLNSIPVLFGITGNVLTENRVTDSNFTQELRFVTDFDSPINFTGGLYYKDQNTTQQALATSQEIQAISLVGSDLFFGALDTTDSNPTTREQFAVFVEGTWDVTDDLTFIAGVRWIDETLKNPGATSESLDEPALPACVLTQNGPAFLNPVAFGTNPCTGTVLITSRDLFVGSGLDPDNIPEFFENEVDEFLPKAAIEYKVNEDMLAYASISKGIRNGGLNSSFVALTPEQLTFGSDTVWAYEIGIKSVWNDGDVVVNIGAYYNDWDDIQIAVSTALGSLLVNGPQASSKGIEIETFWKLNENMSVFLNANYNDATFGEDFVLADAGSAALLELLGLGVPSITEGDRLSFTPEYSITGGADFSYPIGNGDMTLVGHVDFQYVGDRESGIGGSIPSDFSILDSYFLANARIGIDTENWGITAFVSNLTNEIHRSAPFRAGPGGIVTGAYVNRPRTFGVTVRANF